MKPRRVVCSLCSGLVVAVAFVVPSGSATAQQAEAPYGAGNGTYTIGLGNMTLRFDNENGQPGGTVRMRSYAMRENFAIESHADFWTTHVLTDSKTLVTPNGCGDVAKGELSGGNLRWLTSLTGYRTDGTIDCDGGLRVDRGMPFEGSRTRPDR